MKFAVSRDGKTVDEKTLVNFDTPNSFDEGIKVFKRAGEKLLGLGNIDFVAGGIAGAFNKDKSELVSSPNMKGWVKKPLKKELQKVFGKNICLENDAAAAGLGEANFGAGKGSNIVAYVTIGTGVGGARIVDGKLDKNTFGFEPGHQIIIHGGEPCSCGGEGHLESYISGRSIERIYGKRASELKSNELQEVIKKLAVGLNNITVMWSPEIIVLGGGIMRDKAYPIPDIKKELKTLVKVFEDAPEIKSSVLGDMAGLYGALSCCMGQ